MCHQTVGLTALHLEAIGITTVIIGSARDIVEELGVPRFVFTDLPLGNPIGPPYDQDQQDRVLSAGLELAAAATIPRTTVHHPVEWSGAPDWRETFMAIDDREHLLRIGEERRARQAVLRRVQSPS